MRTFQTVIALTNTDVLQATILQTVERDGQLDVFALSSVDDAGNTISITPPGSEAVAVSSRIVFEARAPRVQDDTPLTVVFTQDGHPVVNVARASGTIQLIFVYRGPGEA